MTTSTGDPVATAGKEYFTAWGASVRLGVSYSTVLRLCAEGRLDCHRKISKRTRRPTNKWLISVDEIDSYERRKDATS